MDTVQDGAQLSAETRAELEALVKGSRSLELNGHSDRIWGHVAMRDPGGQGFWIKRHGTSLGEVFDADDFQLTSFESAGQRLIAACPERDEAIRRPGPSHGASGPS